MCDLWYKKQQNLEKQLIAKALDLFEHMGSANACRIPIPNTKPQVTIMIGDERMFNLEIKDLKKQIRKLTFIIDNGLGEEDLKSEI